MDQKTIMTSFTSVVILLILIATVTCPVDFGEAQTGTSISGILTQDVTWTKESSPYFLTGNLLVSNGVTLIIQPGTTVNLANYYIMVNGTLKAKGNSNDPIAFNGGEIQFTKSSTGWNETAGTGCIVENSTFNVTTTEALGISSSVKVSNCTIRSSDRYGTYGINIGDGSPTIINNTISGAYRGIQIYAGTPTIVNNFLSNNYEAIFITGGSQTPCSPLISKNVITDDVIGIDVSCYGSGTANIAENLILNSKGSEIFNIMSGGTASVVVEGSRNYKCNILNNTIFNSNCSLVLPSSPQPILTFKGNNVYGDSQYDVYLRIGENVNLSENWWGTTDNQTIDHAIYDFYDNFGLGVVTYQPILLNPNPKAPVFVNASTTSGGKVIPSGIIFLGQGENQEFSILPSPGYRIADVLINGSSIGIPSSYAVQNVSGATSFSAVFSLISSPPPTPVIAEFPNWTALVVLGAFAGVLVWIKKKRA